MFPVEVKKYRPDMQTLQAVGQTIDFCILRRKCALKLATVKHIKILFPTTLQKHIQLDAFGWGLRCYFVKLSKTRCFLSWSS